MISDLYALVIVIPARYLCTSYPFFLVTVITKVINVNNSWNFISLSTSILFSSFILVGGSISFLFIQWDSKRFRLQFYEDQLWGPLTKTSPRGPSLSWHCCLFTLFAFLWTKFMQRVRLWKILFLCMELNDFSFKAIHFLPWLFTADAKGSFQTTPVICYFYSWLGESKVCYFSIWCKMLM